MISKRDSLKQNTKLVSAKNALQVPSSEYAQLHQCDPTFCKGRDLFLKLKANTAQEYKNFMELDLNEMTSQINDLQYWIDQRGPEGREEILSEIYLDELQQFRLYLFVKLDRKSKVGYRYQV